MYSCMVLASGSKRCCNKSSECRNFATSLMTFSNNVEQHQQSSMPERMSSLNCASASDIVNGELLESAKSSASFNLALRMTTSRLNLSIRSRIRKNSLRFKKSDAFCFRTSCDRDIMSRSDFNNSLHLLKTKLCDMQRVERVEILSEQLE